jgi:hypothetical protein
MARTSRKSRRTSPLHLPGAFELFTPSKEIVLKNIWIFGPLYAVPFIFWIHSWIWSPLPNQSVSWWQHSDALSAGWVGNPFPTYSTFLVVGFSLLWFVIIAVIGTLVQVMTQAAQLRAAEDRELDFHELWQEARNMGWSMFKLYVSSALAIVFTLFIFTRRYFLAPYVMLDKKLTVMDSLRESSRLSGKNPGSVWGVIGVVVLISLVGILPIIGGLASFALGALYSVAPALRYQQLKKISSPAE